ncbi:MAG: NHLP leader peptide family RiPP precursor [Gemmatimonadota bacterium]
MDEKVQSRKDLEAKLVELAQKDEQFAEALRRNPRAAIEKEIGALPEGMNVKVIEEDANTFYLILPPSEETGDFALSEEDLASVAGGAHTASCCGCTGTNWPQSK